MKKALTLIILVLMSAGIVANGQEKKKATEFSVGKAVGGIVDFNLKLPMGQSWALRLTAGGDLDWDITSGGRDIITNLLLGCQKRIISGETWYGYAGIDAVLGYWQKKEVSSIPGFFKERNCGVEPLIGVTYFVSDNLFAGAEAGCAVLFGLRGGIDENLYVSDHHGWGYVRNNLKFSIGFRF